MIIDSHAHIGKILNFNMPEDMILESMEKYGVTFALISNGEACEVDHEQNLIPFEQQFTQLEVNEKIINFAKQYPNQIGALLWIKPKTEGCNEDFEQLIIKNRPYIYGIKVHPYHSKVAFNSKEVEPYIKLAQKYSLPVVTHTDGAYESGCNLVYEVALKYPDVNFVMYHMGLGTDNEHAIDLIAKLPNLYGDTAWVYPEKTLKAIEKCGSQKILFGTDNPINGVDTYHDPKFYEYYFGEIKNEISKEDYENFIYKNAINLFGIKHLK